MANIKVRDTIPSPKPYLLSPYPGVNSESYMLQSLPLLVELSIVFMDEDEGYKEGLLFY